MAFTDVDVGTTANDGTGDTLRAAFQTVNANFALAALDADKADLNAAGELDEDQHPDAGLFRSHTRAAQYSNPAGARSTASLGSGAIRSIPLRIWRSTSVNRIGVNVTTAGAAGSVIRLGIYDTAEDGSINDLVLDAGTIDATTTGAKEITISQALTPGTYWLTALAEGAPASNPSMTSIQSFGDPLVGPSSAAGVAQAGAGYGASGITTGSLPATGSGLMTFIPANCVAVFVRFGT